MPTYRIGDRFTNPAEIDRPLRARGYSSFIEFVHAYPGVSYEHLADILGEQDIAAAQVAAIHVSEAARLGDPVASAEWRDSLFRYVSQAFKRRGWGEGPHWRTSIIGAISIWAAVWESLLPSSDVVAIVKKLDSLQPPQGWRPTSSDDELLVALFRN